MWDLLWGCNSLWNGAIINHCRQEALSYLCFPLWWVIPTEKGWPTWSSAVSLIDRSYAPGGLYWKNLLFKPEPGQFVLWLSRQWSVWIHMRIALLWARDEHQITWWRWEHAHSASWGGYGGPPYEICVWHLIFLTMKDDNAVADANFFQMEKDAPCLISSCICGCLPLYSEIRWIFICNILEYVKNIVRFLHPIQIYPIIKQHMETTLLSNFAELRFSS